MNFALALVLFAAIGDAGVGDAGVESSWRPLPDGSAQSEFVVTLDAAALDAAAGAEGGVASVTVDVPREAGVIGAVRIVVARASAGRRPPHVALKPAGGITLTQFTDPPPRYGVAPTPAPAAPAAATVPPPATVLPPAAYDAFTGVPPTAVGAATAAPLPPAGSSLPPAGSSLPPAGSSLPPAGSPGGTWNGGAPANPWNPPGGAVPQVASNPVDGPFQRLGAELQNAAAPVQDGINRFGDRLRTAAGNVGGRTGQILDQFDQPFTGGATSPAAAAAAAAPPLAGSGAATEWNPAAGGTNWNPDAAAAAGGGAAGGTASDGERWANSGDRPYDAGGPATGAPSGDSTTTWPGDGTDLTGNAGLSAGEPGRGFAAPGGFAASGATGFGARDGSAAALPAADGIPAITADMFNLPPDRLLDGLAPPTGSPAAAGVNPLSTLPPPPAATPVAASAPTGAAAPSWTLPAAASPPAAQQAAQADPAASSARDKAAVILSWTLLFASIAGNVYLFWSYLDVRTKYRALVRKTARAVGGRFSAA
jgi:hypothetical protein